jgi:hypothetical protein
VIVVATFRPVDTWVDRDLPVLRFLVERFDDPRAVAVRDFREIAEATGLTGDQIERAVFALAVTASPPYVLGTPVAEIPYPIPTGVTERARRAAGAWPTPESFAEEFVTGLAAAIEREPDPEKRSRLRTLLGSAGGAVKDLSVEVAAAMISRSIGA